MDLAHFGIYLCTDADCATWDDSSNLILIAANIEQSDPIPGEYHVSLGHDNFAVDSYYKVIISDTIRDIHGAYLGDDPSRMWSFGVGLDNCIVESVTVDPVNTIATLGDSVDYLARAYTDNDICYPGGQSILCDAGSNCEWLWQSTAPAIAGILADGPANNAANTLSIGDTDIIATATQVDNPATPSGSGHLTVIPAELAVINHWPDCNSECYNVDVRVEFNIPVVVDNNLFHIVAIDDPGTELVTSVGFNPDHTIATLNHDDFLPNTEYQATIEGALLAENGDDLGDDYIWTFITGTEDCKVTGVDVMPASHDLFFETATGGFSAFTFTESAVCGNVYIDCTDCTYAWSTGDATIADVIPPIMINQDDFTDPVTLASGSDFADISCVVDEIGNVNLPTSDSGRVNVSIDAELLRPEVISVEPNTDVLMCLNSAVLVGFSELMDVGTLRHDIRVYQRYDEAIPGEECFPYGGGAFYCKIDGTFAFDDSQDLDGDGNNETMAYFYSSNPFDADTVYGVVVGENVASIYGMTLINTQIILDTNDDGIPDSFYSSFGTDVDAHVCAINTVTITPSIDWFTCAHDTCGIEDKDPATPGNQHEYLAHAFSIYGTELSIWGLDYAWNSLNTDLFTVETGNQSVFGTAANTNGQTVLTVDVDGTANDLGTGSAAAEINLFICEVPWPDPWAGFDFPWKPDELNPPGDDDYLNLSTYYCVNPGTEGSTVLPTIEFERNLNHPPEVMVEYIAHVEELITLNESSSPFGTLSRSWFDKVSGWFANKARGQGGAPRDIIGLRAMQNTEHLPIRDWYVKFAPHSTVEGTFFEADGYEAYQVGNTIYIAGTNLDEAGSALYTNVYIIAYNVGARPDTISIASQLINNILLNINIDQGVNICFTEDTRICSSDFDCPGECQGNPDLSPEECADLPEIWVADSCQALGDKLRRDTQRLGNLLSIKNAIEDYGQSHKACSNNNTISCNTDAGCPGGACWQFYPLLNAGTYIDGMSTTGWPSWQETLSPVLLSSIQDDPINLFNGCPSETDPNTCWNETDLEFICPDKSLIYLYNSLSGGTDYYLGANFEYDQTSPTVNFRNHLFNGPDPLGIDGTGAIMGNIYSNLNDMTVPIEHRYCDDTSITSPGGSTSPHCGDSFVDDPPEECDGNTRDYMCDEFLGEQDWWDEQTLGCYPSGSLDWICEDGGGNRLPIYNEDDCVAPNNWVYQIMECRWFEYELTSEICGGYCGDGALQPFYESCESCTGNGDGSADCNGVLYTCGDGLDPFCHPDSCMPMCNDGSAASACGDGEWNPLNEQCDWSAEPPADGVYGWDCTEGGNITCNSFCEHECDPSGDPYFGICGDGLVDPVNEECDPLNHGPISPDESGIDNQYACTDECEDTGGYCGDTELQYSDGEYCDFDTDTGNYNIGYDGEVPPSPPDTSENEQYICQSDPAAIYDICTMTAGGYCGDEIRQLVYGEYCDCGNDPWCGGGGYPDGPANPGASSIDLQYECTSSGLNACLTSTGGYCGDGIFDDGGDNTYRYDHGNNHLEECDDGDADNFNLCSNICTWNCTDPNDAFNNNPYTHSLNSSTQMTCKDEMNDNPDLKSNIKMVCSN